MWCSFAVTLAEDVVQLCCYLGWGCGAALLLPWLRMWCSFAVTLAEDVVQLCSYLG
jgi:hypothetical protein